MSTSALAILLLFAPVSLSADGACRLAAMLACVVPALLALPAVPVVPALPAVLDLTAEAALLAFPAAPFDAG